MAKKKHDNQLDQYNQNIDHEKNEIIKKIENLEQKLISLQNKETIINSLINKINIELENTNPTHFKAISQIRTTLNKQFETLSLIVEMIMKIEDMIQKYRKMLIDIENSKINNFIKLQKELGSDENNLIEIFATLNQKLENSPLAEEALLELKEDGYKV
jgi:hypothetical protein